MPNKKRYKQAAVMPNFQLEQSTKDKIYSECDKRDWTINKFLNKAIDAYLNKLNLYNR